MSDAKPLGIKAYGHIAHLPGSRVGAGDHTIGVQQSLIATAKCRKGEWARRGRSRAYVEHVGWRGPVSK